MKFIKLLSFLKRTINQVNPWQVSGCLRLSTQIYRWKLFFYEILFHLWQGLLHYIVSNKFSVKNFSGIFTKCWYQRCNEIKIMVTLRGNIPWKGMFCFWKWHFLDWFNAFTDNFQVIWVFLENNKVQQLLFWCIYAF